MCLYALEGESLIVDIDQINEGHVLILWSRIVTLAVPMWILGTNFMMTNVVLPFLQPISTLCLDPRFLPSGFIATKYVF